MSLPTGDPTALAESLAAAGIDARVTGDGRLALVAAAADTFADAATRATAVRLARAHAFTHVALLLDDDGR